MPFNTAYYDDGATDSIVISAIRTPSSCTRFQPAEQGKPFCSLSLTAKGNELSSPAFG
jgi:hypothetical protein